MEPTRPKPRPARPSKSPDDRKVPVNNNFSLLIIVVVVCVGLAAFLLPYSSPVVIKFGHLQQLIEKGAPSETNKDPSIDVTESHNGQELTVRYSNLSDLQVGPERNHRQSHAGSSRPGGLAHGGQEGRAVHLLALRAGSRQRPVAQAPRGQRFSATSRADRRPALGRAISCSSR